MESFTGSQIHSLCYRRNNIFKDKKVLVVGAGPSGMDIGVDIAEVAEKVMKHSPKTITYPEIELH